VAHRSPGLGPRNTLAANFTRTEFIRSIISSALSSAAAHERGDMA
jgi:hypothetical protein